jgi:hypothetical protein
MTMTMEWRVVAELSRQMDKDQFEKSWKATPGFFVHIPVQFEFDGCRVLITIRSTSNPEWKTDDLRWVFKTVLRRLDQNCNVKWL